jgi:hypothetical protein
VMMGDRRQPAPQGGGGPGQPAVNAVIVAQSAGSGARSVAVHQSVNSAQFAA